MRCIFELGILCLINELIAVIVYVGVCPIGVGAVNEKGELVEFGLFDKDATAISQKLVAFQDGKGFEELDEVILKLGEAEIDRNPDNKASRFLSVNFRKLAIEKGFVKDQKELNSFLVGLGRGQTREKIKKTEKRDRLIVQAVSAVNDLDKIVNIMSERLGEWYGLHYPELGVRDHEKFAKRVAKCGNRRNFDKFEKSMGMELNEKDAEVLQGYAEQLAGLYKIRKQLESYLDKATKEEIPNLRALLGGTLAARLLSFAGTLERLAKMPSSKLQLQGSERALFRFMKEKKQGRKNARPPRFGILFTHPDISGAPNEKRGKVARLLASKCTIAARMDFYTKEDHGEELKKDYEEKKKKVLG